MTDTRTLETVLQDIAQRGIPEGKASVDLVFAKKPKLVVLLTRGKSGPEVTSKACIPYQDKAIRPIISFTMKHHLAYSDQVGPRGCSTYRLFGEDFSNLLLSEAVELFFVKIYGAKATDALKTTTQ